MSQQSFQIKARQPAAVPWFRMWTNFQSNSLWQKSWNAAEDKPKHVPPCPSSTAEANVDMLSPCF